jgi:hypothetical protein
MFVWIRIGQSQNPQLSVLNALSDRVKMRFVWIFLSIALQNGGQRRVIVVAIIQAFERYLISESKAQVQYDKEFKEMGDS